MVHQLKSSKFQEFFLTTFPSKNVLMTNVASVVTILLSWTSLL